MQKIKYKFKRIIFYMSIINLLGISFIWIFMYILILLNYRKDEVAGIEEITTILF